MEKKIALLRRIMFLRRTFGNKGRCPSIHNHLNLLLVAFCIFLISCEDKSSDPVECPEVQCNVEIDRTYTILNETQAEFVLVVENIQYSKRVDMGTECVACFPEKSSFSECTIPADTLVVCHFNFVGNLSGGFFLAQDGPLGPPPGLEFTIRPDSTFVAGIN